MSVAALILALVAVVLILLALRALRRVQRSLVALHDDLDALAAGAATLDDLRAAVGAPGESEPADAPEPVVSRVPPVLRTRSVVKAMALGTGTAHAARRLRNGRSS